MLKVGITGGIGSGKTMVTKILGTFGIPSFDADIQAKQIMNQDPLIREAIIKNFGNVYKHNLLDAKALAAVVFANEKKLKLLNSIVHPATIDYWHSWVSKEQHAPYVVKEAAILFESGTTNDLEYIIGVYAPAVVRIKRVMQRNGSTRTEVKNRMGRQLNEELKMKLCDFVIVNNDKSLIVPQILEIHQKIMAKSRLCH